MPRAMRSTCSQTRPHICKYLRFAGNACLLYSGQRGVLPNPQGLGLCRLSVRSINTTGYKTEPMLLSEGVLSVVSSTQVCAGIKHGSPATTALHGQDS